MKIVYLVHDLGDPAVGRRIETFRRAGAEVALAGFRRKDALPQTHDVATVIELGRTFDHKMAHRAAKTLSVALGGGAFAGRLPAADVIVARNLEMLLIAKIVQKRHWPKARLAYEVLDVHRMMLRTDLVGAALRWVEKSLSRAASAVIISSPAFRDEYFTKVQKLTARYFLAENKVMADGTRHQAPPPGPPWRIAWYGMLRCQKSLDILDEAARALGGAVTVEIRGRPTHGHFRNFTEQVAANPHLEYLGPYAPRDIWAHYERAHFVWGIDYTDEGVNSAWLLPNRLYEGGAANVPILALADVETGRWLARHETGVLMQDPAAELPAFFRSLDTPGWLDLVDQARRIPRSALLWSTTESDALLKAING